MKIMNVMNMFKLARLMRNAAAISLAFLLRTLFTAIFSQRWSGVFFSGLSGKLNKNCSGNVERLKACAVCK